MMWRYSQKDTKVLLVATLLVFSGYALVLAQSWQQVGLHELALTANTVGVAAGVDENRVNTYLAQLDERERALDAREATLVGNPPASDPTVLIVVTIGGSALFGLILLNFYLDHKRRMSIA